MAVCVMFAVNMFTQRMLFSSLLLLLLAAPSWQVTVGSECELDLSAKAVRRRFWILLLIACLSLNVVPLIITLCEHWLFALLIVIIIIFFLSVIYQVFVSFIC